MRWERYFSGEDPLDLCREIVESRKAALILLGQLTVISSQTRSRLARTIAESNIDVEDLELCRGLGGVSSLLRQRREERDAMQSELVAMKDQITQLRSDYEARVSQLESQLSDVDAQRLAACGERDYLSIQLREEKKKVESLSESRESVSKLREKDEKIESLKADVKHLLNWNVDLQLERDHFRQAVMDTGLQNSPTLSLRQPVMDFDDNYDPGMS